VVSRFSRAFTISRRLPARNVRSFVVGNGKLLNLSSQKRIKQGVDFVKVPDLSVRQPKIRYGVRTQEEQSPTQYPEEESVYSSSLEPKGYSK
jgi:hypothetical protein